MKYWVFDLDGTLIDSFGFYLSIITDLFEQHEISLTPDHIKSCLGLPASKFFEMHLGREHVNDAMDFLKSQSGEDLKSVKLFSGIMNSIKQLSSSGYAVAIWTSRDLASTEELIEYNELTNYIDFYVTSCCVENHKPHPEGLLKIAKYFSCDPTELVMIGDHDFDMHAAKAVGAKAIRASWHSHDSHGACSLSDHQFYKVDDFSSWHGVVSS